MMPNIYKNDVLWEESIRLDKWNKYFEADLKIGLNVGGDKIIDEITFLHERGYDYLISEQSNILKIALDEIYNKYSVWQSEYGYDGVGKEKLMPNITDKQELISLICSNKIFIIDVVKNEFPYLGIKFDCKWDEDHGIGLMLYKNRVVEIGGSDTAFMSWIAEEDKEK